MSEANDSGGAPGSDGSRRYTRRLSDKILGAFHQACDQSDYEAARRLLQILEVILERTSPPSPGNRRKSVESLVAAHERLWHLRHGR